MGWAGCGVYNGIIISCFRRSCNTRFVLPVALYRVESAGKKKKKIGMGIAIIDKNSGEIVALLSSKKAQAQMKKAGGKKTSAFRVVDCVSCPECNGAGWIIAENTKVVRK